MKTIKKYQVNAIVNGQRTIVEFNHKLYSKIFNEWRDRQTLKDKTLRTLLSEYADKRRFETQQVLKPK